MASASTWMAVVYFTLNLVLLVCLVVFVKMTQTHKSIKSTSFLKAIWSQRKIFGPMLVYFYDIATDIAVLVYWYELAHDGNDYQSVNPIGSFRAGIVVLALYKACMLGFVFYMNLMRKDNFSWFDMILVLLDLYIFKTVYLSYQQAQSVIAATELEKQKAKTQSQAGADDEKAAPNEESKPPQEPETDAPKPGKTKIAEPDIQPHLTMKMNQLIEALMESFFQLLFQTTFILQAGDEPLLKDQSGALFLMIVSVLGSLFSISNKFGIMDEAYVVEKAASLKAKKEFPSCVAYWYLVRMAWRISDVGVRFVVWLLVGTVFGYFWVLALLFGCCVVMVVVLVWRKIANLNYMLHHAVGWAYWTALNVHWLASAIKQVIDVISFILIGILASGQVLKNRYLTFFIMGIVLLTADTVLYYVMKWNNILVQTVPPPTEEKDGQTEEKQEEETEGQDEQEEADTNDAAETAV